MDTPSPRDAALQSALADVRKVLEYLDDPRYGPIEAYFQGVLAPYEQLLHNVNVDQTVRDRACFAVDVLTKALRIKAYFQKKAKDLEAKLNEQQDTPGAKAPPWDRILTLVR